MTNSNYLIDVSDLHKSFGELQVLKGVSEHISKGEVVSIIGPSGGGKSTFLRCLNLLEVRTSPQRVSTSTCTVRRWAWCSNTSTSSRT